MNATVRQTTAGAVGILVAMATASWFAGCSTGSGGLPRTATPTRVERSSAAADAAQGVLRVDLAAANRMWPAQPRARSVDDFFRLQVSSTFGAWSVDTHLFREGLVVIPYHDQDGVADASGRFVERGDSALARAFPPGEIGIAVRHHRPKHRTLRIDDSQTRFLDEAQLRDSHVEILVGVLRDGQPGVVTLNSPQGYESGRFGEADYPMLLLAPRYPDGLSEKERRRYRDNIRTYLLAFNEVLRFPFGYLEGDHLAARDRETVKEHAVMVVRAIAGDPVARQWFAEPANRLYCSELAFLSLSAGLLFPLNASTFEPLVGSEVWQRFSTQVERHGAEEPSELTRLNRNPLARLVTATLAPEQLESISVDRRAEGGLEEDGELLALRPMTVPDIFEHFIAWVAPRESPPEGMDRESMAAVQSAILIALEPEVLRFMGLDRRPVDDPERKRGTELYQSILAVLEAPHSDYAAMRAELDPVLAEARAFCLAGGRPKRDLLVPPVLFHLAAAGRWPGGLLGLRYVGHGIHWSLVSLEEPVAH